MSLEELQKKLYQQKKDEARLQEALKPWLVKKSPPSPQKPELKPPGLPPQGQKRKKYLILMASISCLLVLASALTFLIYRQARPQFRETQIALSIEAPDKITSGDEVLYQVHYSNSSQLAIKNLELTFYFPQGSLTEQQSLIQNIQLKDLGTGQSGSAEFQAILVGNKGEPKEARAVLAFQPENISSRFQKEAKKDLEIFYQPLVLDIELPERISKKQPFNFSLECLNTSEINFNNLAIKVLLPPSLEILSSQPPANENETNLWPIQILAGGQRFKINLQAQTEEDEGEFLSLKAQVGRWSESQFEVYSETLEKTQITKPALAISQTVNGQKEYIASPEELLTFKLHYQNTTDIAIPQVIIKAKLEGSLFDFDSLTAPESFFDRPGQIITWNWRSKDELVLLGASADDEIEFSIKLKSDLPIRNFSDQNFNVSAAASCDSEKIPFELQTLPVRGEDQVLVKIRSKLTLQTKGYYRDSPIANTGPIPPRVGEKTTYTLVWQLMNQANDLENLEVRAKLPGHVTWENKISPAEEKIIFNQTSGEVIWKIDKLLANTGLLRPVRQTAFQVSITPSDNHLGQTLTLIGQSQANGLDSFVQEQVTSQAGSITTSLPDDFLGQPGQGVVTN